MHAHAATRHRTIASTHAADSATSCPARDLRHCLVSLVSATTYWFVATWIARAIVERTRPSSIVSRPAMVQPPGAAVVSHCSLTLPTSDRVLELRGVKATEEGHSASALDC